MTVWTEQGQWLVPPGMAVWVPAGVEHRVFALSDTRFVSLYIRPEALAAGPLTEADCAVVDVPPLLAMLIGRHAALPDVDEGRAARLAAVLLDELAELEPTALHLPLPRDRRALAVARRLIDDPADERDLAAWGRTVGASARTLARLFVGETGLGFAAWRQRRRLLAAVERLVAGEKVTAVALDLGYRSPSAFTAMFRRVLGVAPTRYFAAAGGERKGAASFPRP